MSRPSAVVISPEAPYPMHGGGAIRTASLLHYLASRYDLDLVLFRQSGDSDPALSLPPGFARHVSTITLPFHSKQPLAWLLRNSRRWVMGVPPLLNRFSGQGKELASILKGKRYDLGLVEHFWCAPYVSQLADSCQRTILDLHNIESELHASCARAGDWPLSTAHRRFERACRQQEQFWLPHFSRLLTTSEHDGERVRRLAPDTPVTVYPNALPLVPVPAVTEEEVLGFSGNFEYHPNIAAVRFLTSEIWPRLAQRHPKLKLRLIGKNPHAVAQYTKAVPGIEITGPVEDAIAELACVKIAIVPLLSGSGTRLKILEAWAAERPVVATSIGAEGLGCKSGHDIVLADTAETFVKAVLELLDGEEDRRRIGYAGRHTFEERFTWRSAWQNLATFV